MTTQHLGELSLDRRYAVLAATVIRLESQLIDATLGMFEKLMGSLARKAERRTEEKTLRSARDLRTHLHTLATACQAVIAARNEHRDPTAAIEQQIAWLRFVKCVNPAQTMATTGIADAQTELLSKYATIRNKTIAETSISVLIGVRHGYRVSYSRQPEIAEIEVSLAELRSQ